MLNRGLSRLASVTGWDALLLRSHLKTGSHQIRGTEHEPCKGFWLTMPAVAFQLKIGLEISYTSDTSTHLLQTLKKQIQKYFWYWTRNQLAHPYCRNLCLSRAANVQVGAGVCGCQPELPLLPFSLVLQGKWIWWIIMHMYIEEPRVEQTTAIFISRYGQTAAAVESLPHFPVCDSEDVGTQTEYASWYCRSCCFAAAKQYTRPKGHFPLTFTAVQGISWR